VIVGGFVASAVLYSLLLWLPEVFERTLGVPKIVGVPLAKIEQVVSGTTAVLGVLTVICSAMIYISTHRMFWNATATMAKFFGTAAVLGVSTIASATLFAGYWTSSAPVMAVGSRLMPWLIGVTALKLAYEASVFRHLWDTQQGDMKRSAMLMRTPLLAITQSRFGLGIVGGLILPALIKSLGVGGEFTATPFILSVVSLAALMAGELLERTLYFSAMSAPRMPGGVGS
jgi:formate dehydrogenase iron-sulfur subunit